MRHGYEIFHPEVEVVAAFYVTVLGFERPEGDSTSDTYRTVRRDELQVGCSRSATAACAPRKPPFGSEIVLQVDDIHAEYARVRASGWPIEDALQDRPWGMTDFRLFDPTGQYIRITGGRAT